ncbi:protein patched homolog 1 isoform X2 [Anoplophora glabripennis]|nr:protein patched homolog 1 isoform X2 [Anoplophora glabripennis]
MRKECYTKSILELWNFNKEDIESLTKDDIIRAINSYDKNTMYGKLKSIDDLLGEVIRNESGYIVGAKALQNFWFLSLNFSAVDMDKTGNYAGTADWASEEVLDWENAFLQVMENVSKTLNNTYYYSGKSFGDISNAAMFQDMDLLCIGIVIMVIYVQLVISKFNWLEARVVLGSVGMLTIGMAFIVGAGLCSLFGVHYGPVHTSLPFLLMGLGVDDMFVILSCWDELTEEEKNLPLPEKIGLMLKHAGVSITITSFTDVIAFLIGSSTILPCLKSFCIYAAAGVLMTFVFAVTFFVACFVLDLRRVESKRNGIFPWIVHENYVPNECSQKRISNKTFEYVYSNIILTTPGKIIVVLITVVCVGFGIESTLKLEQRFKTEWLIPAGSHLAEFLKVKNFYYPEKGFDAGFYMGALDYSHELNNIRDAASRLENMSDVTANVVSWVEPFRDFVLYNFKHDVFEEPLDDVRFHLFLSKFLNSPRYAKFQANFIFDGDLECGAPTPRIKMSIIDFHFHRFENPRDQIPAMHRVRDLAENANFTTGDKFATTWSKFFATWITDELIDIEVMRNLQLALLCVMLCTILLIADWQICFWIFICVLVTMVNVCGFMQRWGLTIDVVSCIGLELAIGLCVDYATHVGHTFLTVHTGSRQDRAVKTMSSIGCAVLFGGLSTFIGVFMMSQSSVYTFQSFFKIFCLVILFGLFHGLVFLPVILSWIGPKPYRVHKPVPQSEMEIS